MPLFAALGLALGQLGPLGWWPLEDPCWGLPRGDPQGESRMRVGCALGPLPPVLAPAPGVKYHEKQHAKGPLGSGRWTFRKMSHLRSRARVRGAQWALLSTRGWRSTHNSTGLGPASPHPSLSLSLSCLYPFLQLRHHSPVGEPQVSALLLTLPASTFSSLTSCRIKSRS